MDKIFIEQVCKLCGRVIGYTTESGTVFNDNFEEKSLILMCKNCYSLIGGFNDNQIQN